MDRDRSQEIECSKQLALLAERFVFTRVSMVAIGNWEGIASLTHFCWSVYCAMHIHSICAADHLWNRNLQRLNSPSIIQSEPDVFEWRTEQYEFNACTGGLKVHIREDMPTLTVWGHPYIPLKSDVPSNPTDVHTLDPAGRLICGQMTRQNHQILTRMWQPQCCATRVSSSILVIQKLISLCTLSVRSDLD